MNINTRQMLEVLAISGSENSRYKAQRILADPTQLEYEMTFAGSFMKAVYSGDYLEALRRADSENETALKSLIK